MEDSNNVLGKGLAIEYVLMITANGDITYSGLISHNYKTRITNNNTFKSSSPKKTKLMTLKYRQNNL